MSGESDYKFEGWQALDKHSIEGQMKWAEYEPKQFANDDVDLKILYCGICGSDLHTASSGWGDMTKMYPQVVGHEIVGEVLRVGPDVKHLKVGDIAGVGAQCDSCLECHWCKDEKENYCSKGMVGTYAGIFSRTSKGSKSYGGYANYWRGPAHFTVQIPDNVDPAHAAPMLCGGATLYSPLKQYGAGTTAKDVGIIGIGGLGHFGILFANAMGANVTAITHSASKDEDAKKLGAKQVIHTGDDVKAAVKPFARSLDLIICSSNAPNLPMAEYLSMIRPGGHFVLVGIADGSEGLSVHPFTLIGGNVHVTGSAIASPSTITEMLEFAGKHNVQPWIKKYKMDDVNEAIPSMHNGEARYRYVLVNTKNGGKMSDSKL